MATTVTDEQIQDLVQAAHPFSLVLLRWGPRRRQDGAEAIEREHQRRMVSLRADGVIAILCPILDDAMAGMAVMTVPVERAQEIIADDPCVRAEMMHSEVYPCLSFPGDSLPG
ncbi:hypothetical protein FK268_07110 [Tsukamurella sputi]|uniref:YCII-related domain-containing protein n=1 Tax=Tsukamurella sputi TaxID=2591848 RepID=A0A5C5RR75_9ACTN|nr:hypothetical protein [Tsukamurella sputi]TWS24993.1 hypothetical protein FK268_07110 [Tsukamurella sputi]